MAKQRRQPVFEDDADTAPEKTYTKTTVSKATVSKDAAAPETRMRMNEVLSMRHDDPKLDKDNRIRVNELEPLLSVSSLLLLREGNCYYGLHRR
jgi:hypothetical protein